MTKRKPRPDIGNANVILAALGQFDSPYWKPTGDYAEMAECRAEIRKANKAALLLVVAIQGLLDDVQNAYGSQGQDDSEIGQTLKNDWFDLSVTWKFALNALAAVRK